MKKRVALIFTLAAVTCGIGFNTDYIKELLDLISQSAMEVVSYDKDNINGESTDSAVDKLGNELDNLSVDKFFGSTGEDESEIVSNTSNTENSQKTPSEMARSTQGTERYPGVDEFVDVVVKKGTVLYRGEPNGTEFFTTLDAIELSGRDAANLFEGLQVEENPVHGYREKMEGYMFNEDVVCAYGIAKANPQFGEGGLPQYFVPNADDLICREILTSSEIINLTQ